MSPLKVLSATFASVAVALALAASASASTQIAEMLDMPVGTVKGRMRLGLEKMRREMQGATA